MYSPERMYGFCATGDAKVFFHREAFHAGSWENIPTAPPPIIGEEVEVECTATASDTERAPRAQVVRRLHKPVRIRGVVETFNPVKGWGFVQGDDGQSYYLHRSEVEGGRLPLPKQEVFFYSGHKNDRPRACYVEVGRLLG